MVEVWNDELLFLLGGGSMFRMGLIPLLLLPPPPCSMSDGDFCGNDLLIVALSYRNIILLL